MKTLTVSVLIVLLDTVASFYMLAAPGRLYRLRDDSMRSFDHSHFGRSSRPRRDYQGTDDPLWIADFNNQQMKPNELNGLSLDFPLKNDLIHDGNKSESPMRSIFPPFYYGNK